MNRTLVISIVTCFLLTTPSCRRRKPEAVAPAPEQTPPAVAAPLPVAPGGGSPSAPTGGGDPTVDIKKFQSRAERNDAWIGKLAGGDPAAKSKALAEIQSAKLSPAELAELRKQAATYSVKIP